MVSKICRDRKIFFGKYMYLVIIYMWQKSLIGADLTSVKYKETICDLLIHKCCGMTEVSDKSSDLHDRF